MQKILLCLGLLVLIAGPFGICGCGDVDLLDEPEHRYLRDISFSDAEEDGVLTIDVIQNDCDDDPVAVDPEVFTDSFAEISISVASSAPGLSLESYSIEYTPLGSADGLGSIVLPPDMVDIPDGYYTKDIPSGSTATFTLTLLTWDTKWEYAINNPGIVVGRIRLSLTLHFIDEFGEDRDITFERTALFGDYNNC